MKRIVTFAVGGPMNSYYAELEAENETILRLFCAQHWPRDWVTTYDPEEFEPLLLDHKIEKFNLQFLCKGWIENYNNELHFHEGVNNGSIY